MLACPLLEVEKAAGNFMGPAKLMSGCFIFKWICRAERQIMQRLIIIALVACLLLPLSLLSQTRLFFLYDNGALPPGGMCHSTLCCSVLGLWATLCMSVCMLFAQLCPTVLWPQGLWPIKLLCPWNSPGKNTGVGCHSLFQGIFPTQGLNLGLLHCRQILYCWAIKEVPCPPEETSKAFTESRQAYSSHPLADSLCNSFRVGRTLEQPGPLPFGSLCFSHAPPTPTPTESLSLTLSRPLQCPGGGLWWSEVDSDHLVCCSGSFTRAQICAEKGVTVLWRCFLEAQTRQTSTSVSYTELRQGAGFFLYLLLYSEVSSRTVHLFVCVTNAIYMKWLTLSHPWDNSDARFASHAASKNMDKMHMLLGCLWVQV